MARQLKWVRSEGWLAHMAMRFVAQGQRAVWVQHRTLEPHVDHVELQLAALDEQ